MVFGSTELWIGATILVLLVIWWLWPSHDRDDLLAPPKNLTGAKPRPKIEPTIEPETPTKLDVLQADTTIVRDESDYSEEELMMRDVRAALHRGRKIEAIKRVRQTKNIGLAEAHAFVESIERSI
ncbi:hypothetical protein GCM10009096_13090 [Parasphingorhabdus litoris]|uniref:Ribosomal protein L7/L12 C-terminal domain-containing protein n=1 Tax=Parasphingorhabdus litoris TaxID=394733 RepID=A0ABN1ACL5_9SPHN|nr:hypothetical protein [Parasphingorhabdus litoris]